jgi:tRNA-dihydrouridine synthase 1
MVGASELPFRLLCRRHGATCAYTPMISSKRFAVDKAYRGEAFQTLAQDRPLVAHFSANDPQEFAAAAKLVEGQADAIDLNLGCPQRTAYVGHYGSYLLDPPDRALVLSLVRAAVAAVRVPVFAKIRLLATVEETTELVRQLRDAGASMVAIHGRYRASFERTGKGARDGPAMLDQIKAVKKALPGFPIVANGNIIEHKDVASNLAETGCEGVMSAEGILDDPALFDPGWGGSKVDLAREQVQRESERSGASEARRASEASTSEGGRWCAVRA